VIYVLAGVIAAIWLFAVIRLNVGREWHHEYIGAALVALVWWPWVQWVGVAVMADDAWQHTVQLTRPTYLSPMHRAWDWVVAHG
jgi:hypothetical protein